MSIYMSIYLMLIGFGLFGGVLFYFIFRNKTIYRFQLISVIVIIIFALLMNFATFIGFNEIITPLIPCDNVDENYGLFIGTLAGSALLGLFAIGLIAGSALGLKKSKKLDHFFKTSSIPNTAQTSEGGKNTFLICPSCKKYLSFRWIFFSLNTTKYTCKTCGTSLVWTRRRFIVSGLVTAGFAILLSLSNVYFNSLWFGVFLGLPIFIILLAAVPGQYRVEE